MSSYYEKILATGEVKCIDKEIPFEIPEGWEWERFGNIMINKDSERVPLSVAQRQQLKKTYDYYGASGVIDKVDKYLFDKDLLLIGEDGANLINRSTPIAFIAKGKYWVNNHAHVLDVCSGMALSYVALFINAISLVDYVTGTAQPKMNQEKMNSILLAIPPVKEQHRILEKMPIVDAFIDKYASLQTKLDSLDNSVYELLMKSILQEAIQGKLVPQIAEEGTAQELLEQIKAEKEKLVKEGKLKKSALNDSVIFKGDDNKYYEQIGNKCLDITDEIPFDIPENWKWIKLDQGISLLSGRDLEPSQYNDLHHGIPYITGASNFVNSNLIINRWTEAPITISNKGDLLLTCKGTIGSMAFNDIGQIHIARQVMAITSYGIDLKYIKCFLQSNLSILEKNANSMIPGISRSTLLGMLFPLPPFKEQQRIVAQTEKLFEQLH
ncbi:MAG: restriction endonuclease subunit S [Sodaliphilus pleomorphus]|uniref:restriction endonuclease subunit S n=1 Tax=Sodaliphilus pleomorphus TaxID=2606626 RepID=UPI002A747FA9|nr:restriction endonuclease subunit S [Sodaliphilus pleomorphus]MDY2831706.1 restriction endonuclease subunit S [Sodaliphilus pleomorphus]